jgi:hypothetical protein
VPPTEVTHGLEAGAVRGDVSGSPAEAVRILVVAAITGGEVRADAYRRGLLEHRFPRREPAGSDLLPGRAVGVADDLCQLTVDSELEPLEETTTAVVSRAQVHQRGAGSETVDRLEIERLLPTSPKLVPDIRPGSDRRVVLRQVRRGEAVPGGVLAEITVDRRRRERIDHRHRLARAVDAGRDRIAHPVRTSDLVGRVPAHRVGRRRPIGGRLVVRHLLAPVRAARPAVLERRWLREAGPDAGPHPDVGQTDEAADDALTAPPAPRGRTTEPVGACPARYPSVVPSALDVALARPLAATHSRPGGNRAAPKTRAAQPTPPGGHIRGRRGESRPERARTEVVAVRRATRVGDRPSHRRDGGGVAPPEEHQEVHP